MLKSECSLCNIVKGNPKGSILNKIIYEWGNFFLIPSIGPIDLGHFLIVSKTHDCGLATMPKDQITDLFKFIEFLISKDKLSDILFFEHGSYDDQDAGSCISHTHIHVIPNYSKYYSVLDNGSLEIVYKNFTIEQFCKIDFPYIMSYNTKQESRIYRAYNAHSQMMRKAICTKKGSGNGDWKANKNIDVIKSGINFWNNMLH